MFRSISRVAVLASMAAWPCAALAQAAAAAPVLSPLYASYASGQYDRLRPAFPTSDSFRTTRDEMGTLSRQWRSGWKPTQAAFLLEVAFVAYERGWDEAPHLLAAARDFLVNRPSPPGRNAAEDRFEMSFHRAAVAFLSGRQLLDHADAYLSALAGRIDTVPSTAGRPRIVDPWLPMARAVLSDLRTAPSNRPGGRSPDAPTSLMIGAGESRLRQFAETAMAGYAQARDTPALAGEAETRRALLLHRLGRQNEALEALNAADKAETEPVVRYWGRLFRGRVLEALGRTEDAGAAYESAAALFAGAQTPAIALASLWQRHDRPADALRWAQAVRGSVPQAFDPWWQYWSGEYRLWTSRLTALRQATP